MLLIQTIRRASFIYALNDIQTLILTHTNNTNAPSIVMHQQKLYQLTKVR